MSKRAQQYHAEGTCDVGTYRSPARFRAFLVEGDSTTRQGVAAEFPRGTVAELQGRVVTFERRAQGLSLWVKTVEARAERVHVQSIYALGWPT